MFPLSLSQNVNNEPGDRHRPRQSPLVSYWRLCLAQCHRETSKINPALCGAAERAALCEDLSWLLWLRRTILWSHSVLSTTLSDAYRQAEHHRWVECEARTIARWAALWVVRASSTHPRTRTYVWDGVERRPRQTTTEWTFLAASYRHWIHNCVCGGWYIPM